MAESYPKYSLLIESDIVVLQKLREGWAVVSSRAATTGEASGNSAKKVSITNHTGITS